MTSLLHVVRSVIKKSRGMEYIAEILGFSHANVLRNQLNESNLQHKLGAEDLLEIIRICEPHSLDIVQVFASQINAVLIPMPKKDSARHELMELILKAGKEFGDISEVLMKSVDPTSPGGIRIIQEELDQIEKEVIDANRAFQEILAFARKEVVRTPTADHDLGRS